METKETSLPSWVLMAIWVTVTKAVENGHQDPLFLTDQLIKSADLLGITGDAFEPLRDDDEYPSLRDDDESPSKPIPSQSHQERI